MTRIRLWTWRIRASAHPHLEAFTHDTWSRVVHKFDLPLYTALTAKKELDENHHRWWWRWWTSPWHSPLHRMRSWICWLNGNLDRFCLPAASPFRCQSWWCSRLAQQFVWLWSNDDKFVSTEMSSPAGWSIAERSQLFSLTDDINRQTKMSERHHVAGRWRSAELLSATSPMSNRPRHSTQRPAVNGIGHRRHRS